MKSIIGFVYLFFILVWFSSFQANAFRTENLRCEYLHNPLGIDKVNPRFSWFIKSDTRDIMQSAYRIVVLKDDSILQDIVWDSGWVPSAENWNIPYSGQPLASQTTYYWKTKVWNQNGQESDWSPFQIFHTGFLTQDGFSAQWIMSPDQTERSPLFRNSFELKKPVKSAYIYAAAIGLYELYVNGQKADDRIFEPAITQYTERVLYSVYDITGLLHDSVNVIGAWMGEGVTAFTEPPDNRFANINMKPSPFPAPMLCLELKLNYQDGGSEIISTKDGWKCSPSPVTFNNFYGGEDYDSRLEQEKWVSSGFDDTNWKNVVPGHYEGKISAQLLPPVTEGKTYLPVSSVKRDSATYDFDFGVTIGGYWEIELEGKEGDVVLIRGAEKCGGDNCQKPLTPDVNLYWGDNHTDRFYQRDCYSKYTLSGKATEIYKPRFFYQGFRYVQVQLSSPEIKIRSIKITETGNSFEKHGEFNSSDPYLNRLHGVIGQTFKNNFIQGVPLSNPNSEKYGWTGDAHLYAESANYNLFLPALWMKWMQDFQDAQQWAGNTGIIPVTVPELRKRKALNDLSWVAAYPLIVWQMYQFYHDRQIVTTHYPFIKKWYQYILGTAKGHIVNGVYGDHLIPGFDKQSSFSTPGMLRLINTAYWYRVTRLLEKMALLSGETTDAGLFNFRSKEIYGAFNNQFYKEKDGVYSESPSLDGFIYELTSNLIPLQMGLVPDEKKQRLVHFIEKLLKVNDCRSFTGILGTKALTDCFQDEDPGLLYKIIQNRDYPGWGFLLDSLGGSTLNQQWDGKGDFNHSMFGSVDAYFFRSVLGIKLDSASTSHRIVISPFLPKGLNFASGKTGSVFGPVSSSWERCPEGTNYAIGIPANSKGIFRFESLSEYYELYIDDELLIKDNQLIASPGWLKNSGLETRDKNIILGSGNYQIKLITNKK